MADAWGQEEGRARVSVGGTVRGFSGGFRSFFRTAFFVFLFWFGLGLRGGILGWERDACDDGAVDSGLN